MSTPINTFQDIMDALERNPELRRQLREHILTEELLQLPAVVGRPEPGDPPLIQQVKKLDSKVGELDSKVDELDKKVDELDKKVDELDKKVNELDGKVDELDKKVDELDGKVERIDSRLGNVAGTQYEERAAHRATSRVRSLGIERGRIVFAPGESQPSFHDAIAEAVDTGLISQEELEDLTATDIIIRGGNHRHAVIEASLGPDQNDLERALRRAGILARAIGEETKPAVAAPELPAELAEAAETLGVAVLEIPA